MRIEVSPFTIQAEAFVSKEARMAQVMSEMQSLAQYRSRKMGFYKQWSATGGDAKAIFGVDLEADIKECKCALAGTEMPWMRDGVKPITIKEKT